MDLNVDSTSSLLMAQSSLHSPVHTYSYNDGSGCHARWWPAHQEQFGAQYLAQGTLMADQAVLGGYSMTRYPSWATAAPLKIIWKSTNCSFNLRTFEAIGPPL